MVLNLIYNYIILKFYFNRRVCDAETEKRNYNMFDTRVLFYRTNFKGPSSALYVGIEI